MSIATLQQICEQAIARQCWHMWGVSYTGSPTAVGLYDSDSGKIRAGSIVDILAHRAWHHSLEILPIRTCEQIIMHQVQLHRTRWCQELQTSFRVILSDSVRSWQEHIPHVLPFVSCDNCEEQQLDVEINRCDTDCSSLLESELYTLQRSLLSSFDCLTIRRFVPTRKRHRLPQTFRWQRCISEMSTDFQRRWSQAALLEGVFVWEMYDALETHLKPLLQQVRERWDTTHACTLAESRTIMEILFCTHCDEPLNVPTRDQLFANCLEESNHFGSLLDQWDSYITNLTIRLHQQYQACALRAPLPPWNTSPSKRVCIVGN